LSRTLALLYILFILAFPLGMAWLETRPTTGPTSCLFRAMTGLDCPGCGMTRAFRAMGRLDIMGAVKYNPLGPAFFVVALACWVYGVLRLVTAEV